jgi:hypothetical protein
MIRLSRTLAALSLAAFALGAVAPPAADARRKAAKVVAVKTATAFKAADTDQSRQLDTAEWSAAGYNSANFATVDRNANGTIGYWEALAAVFASLKSKAGTR